MADYGVNNRIRVRKKSERIAVKTSFSNFKNTMETPVDVDAEIPLELPNKGDKLKVRIKVKTPVLGDHTRNVEGKEISTSDPHKHTEPVKSIKTVEGIDSSGTSKPPRILKHISSGSGKNTKLPYHVPGG